jgi:hypothetical protein
MPKFEKLEKENVACRMEGIWMERTWKGHTGHLILTDKRLVFEASGSPTAGILLKLILPFLGDRVMLDLPNQGLYSVTKGTWGKREIIEVRTAADLYSIAIDKIPEALSWFVSVKKKKIV